MIKMKYNLINLKINLLGEILNLFNLIYLFCDYEILLIN